MGDPLSAVPPASALLAVALAALAGGLSRGFSGFGAALVFVPLASAAVGPRDAVPLLAILEFMAGFVFLRGAWRDADRVGAATMAAGAMVGVPAGALILARTDPVALRWGLCMLVVVAVVVLASGWRWRGGARPALTLTGGAIGGVMSGAAMLGGVAPATYWLGVAGNAARQVRANMNLYFALLTLAVVLAFAWQGLLGWRTLWFGLAAGPAYGAGLWGGSALFGIAGERGFRNATFVLILASALIGLPLWDGARP